MLLDRGGDVVFDRAGMGLLFLHTQFREQVKNQIRFDLQLTGQLIDSDFGHLLNR
jgi:hypothetical protein